MQNAHTYICEIAADIFENFALKWFELFLAQVSGEGYPRATNPELGSIVSQAFPAAVFVHVVTCL